VAEQTIDDSELGPQETKADGDRTQTPPPPSGKPIQAATALGMGNSSSSPFADAAKALPPVKPLNLLLVVLAAIGADIALRMPGPSLAGSLSLMLVLALILTSRPTFGDDGEGRLGLAASVLVVGLSSILALRTSPWVTGTTIPAVLGLLVLIATDGLNPGRPWPWLRSTVLSAESLGVVFPWSTLSIRRAMGEQVHNLSKFVRIAAIVILVVLALGGLLASGDAVFASVFTIEGLGPLVSHLSLVAVLIVPAAVVLVMAQSGRTYASDPFGLESGPNSDESGRFIVESRAAVWAVAVVLSLWCVVQVVVISGGAEAALDAQGLSPAEYARRGFFQLVAAAALSLTVLNVAHRLGHREHQPEPGQRIPVSVTCLVLGVLIVITYSRLWYYVETFGLTMLRLSVATFLVWLATMTAISFARSFGVGAGVNWLPPAAVLSAGFIILAFGAINPEGFVASTNLGRTTESEKVDVSYLRTLSDDAKPTIEAFDWSQHGGQPQSITRLLCAKPASTKYGLFSWNMSRYERPDSCPNP